VVEAANGRLLARPVPALSGLLEVRQIGIREMPVEPVVVVSLVVDFDPDAHRLPDAAERVTEITGITLPRLALPPENDALAPVLLEISALAARRKATAGR